MAEEQSLRSLLASFVVEVDKAGNLAKGNAAVDGLKRKLEELTAAAAPAGKALDGVWEKIARNASASVAAMKAVNAAQALTGGGSGDGFAAAGRLTAPQLGPTRDTLNAYSSTFGGRINRAIQPHLTSFKEGFANGGGISSAIGGLATLRNGILALGAGAAVHALTGLVDRIGDISESAARLGVSVEEFQRLDVLAKQSGTSVGSLGTAFRTLAGAAVDPTKESTAAFAKLGVTTKDTAGAFKSRQELFFDTAGALADVSDGTERAALAQKLFGRGATELLPLLANGRAGLEKQRDALMQMPVLTKALVEQADALSDSWKELGPRLLVAAGPILEGIVFPALRLITDWLFKAAKGVAHFVSVINPARGAIIATGLALAGVGAKIASTAGGWAKLAGNVSKAALQFALIAAAFLVIEDAAGFANGDDSITGRLATKLFGKDGAEKLRQDILAIAEAVKQVFRFLTGQNVEGAALASALGVKPQGVRTADQAQAAGEKTFASASDLPLLTRLAAYATGGLPDPNRNQGGTIPLAPGQFGPPTPVTQPTVNEGDKTIIINGVNPNNASAVAGAVSGALGRDRAATITPYLVGGGV